MWCLGREGGECPSESNVLLLSLDQVSVVTRRRRVLMTACPCDSVPVSLFWHLDQWTSWIPSGPRIILCPVGPFLQIFAEIYKPSLLYLNLLLFVDVVSSPWPKFLYTMHYILVINSEDILCVVCSSRRERFQHCAEFWRHVAHLAMFPHRKSSASWPEQRGE